MVVTGFFVLCYQWNIAQALQHRQIISFQTIFSALFSLQCFVKVTPPLPGCGAVLAWKLTFCHLYAFDFTPFTL